MGRSQSVPLLLSPRHSSPGKEYSIRLRSKDIAEILNISPSAVSLAINGRPGVSEETRNKVNSVIEDYYNNGMLKKDLVDKTVSGSIIFIIHKTFRGIIIPSQFFQIVTESIQTHSIKNGYNLEISYYNSSIDAKEYIESLSDDRVRGIILLATEMSPSDLDMYTTLKKPLVLLDARFDSENIDSITLNNKDAMIHAVEYAYSMGHRKIGYIKSSLLIPNYEERFKGYLEGLAKVGLEYDEAYVFRVHCSMEGAEHDFKSILDESKPELPSVLIADLDYMAIGVMGVLKERGYRIPDDVSLIGFDDISSCRQIEPKLTTLRVDRTHIGALAVNRLIDKINGENAYYVNIEIGTKLIKRESVKRLNI